MSKKANSLQDHKKFIVKQVRTSKSEPIEVLRYSACWNKETRTRTELKKHEEESLPDRERNVVNDGFDFINSAPKHLSYNIVENCVNEIASVSTRPTTILSGMASDQSSLPLTESGAGRISEQREQNSPPHNLLHQLPNCNSETEHNSEISTLNKVASPNSEIMSRFYQCQQKFAHSHLRHVEIRSTRFHKGIATTHIHRNSDVTDDGRRARQSTTRRSQSTDRNSRDGASVPKAIQDITIRKSEELPSTRETTCSSTTQVEKSVTKKDSVSTVATHNSAMCKMTSPQSTISMSPNGAVKQQSSSRAAPRSKGMSYRRDYLLDHDSTYRILSREILYRFHLSLTHRHF